jgi:hypothetical protein
MEFSILLHFCCTKVQQKCGVAGKKVRLFKQSVFLKHTTIPNIGNEQGNLICRHFPTVAVASNPQTMRGLNVRWRDTIDVQVGDAQFEVGPDTLQAHTGNDVGREIGNNCSKSQNCKALMLGTMHYMDIGAIDLLVLVLPVEPIPVSRTLRRAHQHLYSSERESKNSFESVPRGARALNF